VSPERDPEEVPNDPARTAVPFLPADGFTAVPQESDRKPRCATHWGFRSDS